MKASAIRTKPCPVLILGALLLIAACLHPAAVCAQAGLEYQNRGDRYEGVRPRPVSGYDIELISALVDYQDPVSALPDHLRIRFFLEEQAAIHLTVRELDVRYYYWLDRARSSQPWGRGFGNEFEWSTDVVLRKLDRSLALSELGAVARLGRPEPSAGERVAPVILYHTRPPRAVHGYVFAFKTSGDARVGYAIYREKAGKSLAAEAPLKPRGGRPFAVHWDASRAMAGPYRLVVSGYLLDSNQPFYQTVRFVHQPAVP